MALITYAAKKIIVTDGVSPITYDNTAGGPIRCELDSSAQELETRVADNLRPTSVEAVNMSDVVSFTLQEFDPSSLPTVGEDYTVTLTIVSDNLGTTADKVFYRMVYMGARQTQDRATPAGIDLRFVHESSDGIKGPTEAS